jgi:hypothetical protein
VRFLAALVWIASSALLAAQESPLPSNAPSSVSPDPASAAAPDPPEGIAPVAPAPEGRILGVIPNNKTVPQTAPEVQAVRPGEAPLSSGEKFKLAVKDTIDPFTIVLAGFYAGIAQWQNDFPTFGQGAQGYGKRIGAAYADQAVGNFMTEAIFPAMLHEDPRYFRKGYGTKWSRISYAVTRTVITRTDAGKNRFNYSEVVGNAVAAGISNLYYPASERTLGETGEKWGVQIVSDSAFNILLEFWPDMRHAVLKK